MTVGSDLSDDRKFVARKRTIIVIVVCALILLAGAAVALAVVISSVSNGGSTQPYYGATTSSPNAFSWNSASGDYRYAAVTSATKICASVGNEVMAVKRGSATDALVATAMCEGIVDLYSSGVGGGLFMTIYDRPRGQPNLEIKSLISRERAPISATADMFVGKPDASVIGGLAIGVPGSVKGFYEAWLRYGRVPWADLIQPSINLCEKGFQLEKSMSATVARQEALVRGSSGLSAIFVKPDGTLRTTGDTIVLPLLANTLKRIAADPNDFYSGPLAADIAADIQDAGGIVTVADLNRYSAYFTDPVVSQLQNGGYTMYSPPPPSGGAVYQFIMNILDGYNFSSSNIATLPDKVLTYHRIIEAFKFAFAKRSQLGDPAFVDVTQLVANMTSENYANYIRSLISDSQTHDVNYYGPTFETVNNASHTTNINVRAPDGSVVVMTNTINTDFGSTVVGKRTGIIFNNEMDDFSTPGLVNSFGVVASPSNFIRPGKIPQSSMSPTIIMDSCGNVVLAVGGVGGTRIITSVSFVSTHTLWFGKSVKDAGDTPRLHHQLLPNLIYYEPNVDPGILSGLQSRGHQLTLTDLNGYCGAIKNKCSCREAIGTGRDVCLEAEVDGRKGGQPDGF